MERLKDELVLLCFTNAHCFLSMGKVCRRFNLIAAEAAQNPSCNVRLRLKIKLEPVPRLTFGRLVHTILLNPGGCDTRGSTQAERNELFACTAAAMKAIASRPNKLRVLNIERMLMNASMWVNSGINKSMSELVTLSLRGSSFVFVSDFLDVHGRSKILPADADEHVSFMEMLHECKLLQNLDMSSMNMGDLSARALGELLMSMPYLTSLNLSRNNLGSEGALALANGLCKIGASLRTLNLSNNPMGDEGAQTVAVALQSCPLLESLFLSQLKIDEGFGCALCESLDGKTNLTDLSLSGNSMNILGATALSGALQCMSRLRRLDLSCIDAHDEGAKAIADSFQFLHALESLDMSVNQIEDDGMCCIAANLGRMPRLIAINLAHNRMRAEGVSALVFRLSRMPDIRKIDVGFNCFGAGGARAFMDAVSRMGNGVQLDLTGTIVSRGDLQRLLADMTVYGLNPR